MPSTHEASSKTFTFIRDPMEHFMAGFSEVIYRSWNNKVPHPLKILSLSLTIL